MAVSAACADRFVATATMPASARGRSIAVRRAKRGSLEAARGRPALRERRCLARAIGLAVHVPRLPCLIANLFW